LRLLAWLLPPVRVGTVALALSASSAWAQQPAAAPSAPNDAPSVRVGVSLFTDYTYTKSPEVIDADGNAVNPSQFNIGRSYINITGNLSHLIAFRVTPDISRETGTGSTLNGSLTVRIKYAFGQVNFDDWLTAGSWTRLGIQQTPWVDFEENIYRYRFQGTVFTEREGFLSSSDGGASFHYNLPSNYGDLHAGVYNGENYNRQEANDQKALQVRGTVRPFAASPVDALHGVRAHVFYNGDHYVKDGERRRFLGGVTFEHRYLNAGFDYLRATDQLTVTRPEADANGYSIWATPRSPSGWELLLRYDHLKPNTLLDSQVRTRAIVGVAYWFRLQTPALSALLFDYDGATFDEFLPARPKEQRFAVHALYQF
jgi:hypothetical protein